MALENTDFESLDTENPYIHMLAGATAGIMEHMALYPLDLVKTRLQSSFAGNLDRSILRNLSGVFEKEGFRALYRGATSVVIGAGPAHAAYFSIYEKSKRKLAKFSNGSSGGDAIIHGISGAIATLGHDLVMNPMEVLKQRLQVCPHRYAGFCDCIRKIIASEGPRAFYRSFPVQLIMNFPFNSSNFIVYEYVRKHTLAGREFDLTAHLISGGVAGGVAALITTPLDVIKTTLNVQDPQMVEIFHRCSANSCGISVKKCKIKGITTAAKTIYNAGGFRAFLSGLLVRVLISIPSCAVSWSVYETFKHILKD